MSKLSDFSVLVLDVFGTIIDWEAGVLAALQPLLGANGATGSAAFSREHLLRVYYEHEAAQQKATPGLRYEELLATIHPLIAASLGLTVVPSAEESAAFGASVGSWPAFPDSAEALGKLGEKYKLAVLSNVDRRTLERTRAGPLRGVRFDLVVTAEDVGSYKPDRKNFERVLREVEGRFGVGREGVLQTAQSQFHDHRTAREVGIRSCWIVRPGAVMGNVEDGGEEVWDWKFDTLADMVAAVEGEGSSTDV
ncbi:hypothetical protein N3K66_002800 [Trichothecium roseum]|uniref:Uncharacterized protein n=1 Tax=Trichothecium roseum TaxID=47278 RepID=A0ACC0VBE9_9HYPO|nr:hypothetical protein N3K66_002800 [Trichothecium roseum]